MILTASAASLSIVLFCACSSADAGQSKNPQTSAASVGSTPAQSVLISLTQSTNAKTAQMDLSANISGIPVVGTERVTGIGSIDFVARKAEAHFDLLGLGVDSIVDGTTAYAKSPLLGDSTWYRLNPGKGDGQGIGGLATVWANMIDPSQLFATLKDSSDSMTEVGHDQVRGSDTIHYHREIDLQKRAQAAGATAEALNAIKESGVSTVPLDVWIDDQGLVVRIQTSLSIGDSSGSKSTPLSGDVTVEFHDYGAAVDISAPPADQVKDLSKATGLGGLVPGMIQTP
jgi:hypothetical protein